jgi:hypothetical protein
MARVTWVAVLAGLVLGGSAALAEPYWFAFEFNDPNDLPPAQGDGWLRRYQPEPFGVVHDGILTYESSDPPMYDFWEYSRPGALDPGPNEVFLCQWRLWVEWVSRWGDPGVTVMSNDAWVVNFAFDMAVIQSVHEYVEIPIPPGDWHSYTLVSADMRAYDLYIDGALARQGSFAFRYIESLLQWGDCWYNGLVTSRHHWDWFRFGAVPVPVTGDVNCDGTPDFRDINPFVQALTDAGAYQASYPGCPPQNADINGDGSIDFGDINPFVDLLLS